MSLEELRKQAEEEEANGTLEAEPAEEETPEADAEDTDSDGQPEGEPEPEEESEDFELEVDGEPEPDQQKPERTKEEILEYKLEKERARRLKAKTKSEEAESELEVVKRQLEELQKSISQPKPVTSAAEPRIPDLYDKEIDGDRDKYDAAMKQWYRDMAAYQNRHNQADQAQVEHKQKLESMTKNLAVRAAKFASENKVKVDRVVDALDKATSEIDDVAGVDGAMAYLLDSVGDGSERVAYYIGTNESARAQLKQLLQDDRNGLKAIAHMTRLVEKLKPKHSKQLSKAPEPDESLKGDKTTSVSADKLQKLWDKETDPQKLMQIRKQAREMGVALKT